MQVPQHVTDELNRLHEMRMSGALAQTDYEQRKRELFSLYGITSPKRRGHPGMFLVWIGMAIAFLMAWIFQGASISMGGIIIATLVAYFLYLLPAFIAYERIHTHRHAILVMNIFLGWSFIGWVAALIWSATSSRTTRNDYDQSLNIQR